MQSDTMYYGCKYRKNKIDRFAGGNQEMKIGLGRFIGSINCVCSTNWFENKFYSRF